MAPEAPMSVVVELYGVARQRAGLSRVHVSAQTLGEALAGLETVCPALRGTVVEAGRLNPHYRVSVNGRRFVSNPEAPLRSGDTLILLSAAAGG